MTSFMSLCLYLTIGLTSLIAVTIDIIYLDFKKVFDLVPNKCLLSKLHSCGFCDPALCWFKSFIVG